MEADVAIADNEAFLLSDAATREQYTLAYQATAPLYFGEQPSFEAILAKIWDTMEKL